MESQIWQLGLRWVVDDLVDTAACVRDQVRRFGFGSYLCAHGPHVFTALRGDFGPG